MDLDPSSSNETARPQRKVRPTPSQEYRLTILQRTANEHTPDKYRAISNPQRGELDSARQAVREAQHANLSLAADADAARAALAAAQAANIEMTNRLLAMQAELIEKSQAIADMQHHEGQMEAQFISDQGKLDTLPPKLQQYSSLFQQINDTQQLLMQRNAADEIAQLRANSRIQAQKTPQKQTTPRRSKRLNMSPLANSGLVGKRLHGATERPAQNCAVFPNDDPHGAELLKQGQAEPKWFYPRFQSILGAF
ncbi:hypothetical protein R3P38DRAFT_3629092 [Favolaschia claudopus]|uniref:Uncharacterized protein n=1 Tax=Favolaschia claudopus TaxID=2862362 RepID=A0AAV9Z770_9AGAR